MTSVIIPGPSRLSEREQYRLEQFKKIIALRDQVLSGTHPHIRIPDRLVGKVPPPNSFPSPKLQPARSLATGSETTLANRVELSESSSASASNATNRNAVEINPVFLEKSSHLIRAEIQIQRQRLEATLKVEVDAKKQANKASIHPEQDLDIAFIYDQAQTLVAVADGQAKDQSNALTTANQTIPDVDSHSEDTFYSSRHSTPPPHKTHDANEDEDDQPMSIDDAASVGELPNSLPTLNTSVIATVNPSTAGQTPISQSQSFESTSGPPNTSQSNFPPHDNPPLSLQPSGYESRNFSIYATAGHSTGSSCQPDADHNDFASDYPCSSHEGPSPAAFPVSTRMDIDQIPANIQPASAQYVRPRRNYGDLHGNSPPVVRHHNLVPAAPRPHHVSTLTRGGVSAVEASVTQPDTSVIEANSSGAEPSPRMSGRTKIKQNKKRKQERTEEVIVKPEPQSPEPLKGPVYAPRKRQKSKRGNQSINLDAVPYSPNYPLPTESRPQRRPADSYAAYKVHDLYAAQEPLYVDTTLQSRAPQYVRPGYVAYSDEYMPPERHVTRYYHEVSEPEYLTSPTVVEREPGSMAPPRAPGALVMVDAYGRPYYEPHRSATRQPPPPHGEEVICERPVRRAPPPEYYDNNVVYRRVSPNYAVPPRRVVTQHDPRNEELRREYSVRPTEEYVPVRPVERRVYTEVPPYARPVSTRPMSVRPIEAVRYEVPSQSYQRLSSVRPEVSGDIHHPPAPRGHFMPPPPPARAYSVVPAERIQRPYSVVQAPSERYYEDVGYVERHPGHAPGADRYGDEGYRR